MPPCCRGEPACWKVCDVDRRASPRRVARHVVAPPTSHRRTHARARALFARRCSTTSTAGRTRTSAAPSGRTSAGRSSTGGATATWRSRRSRPSSRSRSRRACERPHDDGGGGGRARKRAFEGPTATAAVVAAADLTVQAVVGIVRPPAHLLAFLVPRPTGQPSPPVANRTPRDEGRGRTRAWQLMASDPSRRPLMCALRYGCLALSTNPDMVQAVYWAYITGTNHTSGETFKVRWRGAPMSRRVARGVASQVASRKSRRARGRVARARCRRGGDATAVDPERAIKSAPPPPPAPPPEPNRQTVAAALAARGRCSSGCARWCACTGHARSGRGHIRTRSTRPTRACSARCARVRRYYCGRTDILRMCVGFPPPLKNTDFGPTHHFLREVIS